MTIRKRNRIRWHLASTLAERAGVEAMADLAAFVDVQPPEERARYTDRGFENAYEDAARYEYDLRIRQGLPQLRAVASARGVVLPRLIPQPKAEWVPIAGRDF